MYRIKISPRAKSDIKNAKIWYEDKQIGLGIDFVYKVIQQINQLQDETVEHKVSFDNIRRVFVNRFPYVIYYERLEDKNLIIIVAVLHEKQDKNL
jgi:toxin ParE1/3/4